VLLEAFGHRRAWGRTSSQCCPWRSVGRNRNVGQVVRRRAFLREGREEKLR